MTFKELRSIPCYQTATIAETMKEDEQTLFYILQCLERFYSGDYGTIPAEDTTANNEDLKSGYGHVLARYKASFNLKHDIYIESHFDKDTPGLDYNNTMIMYVFER